MRMLVGQSVTLLLLLFWLHGLRGTSLSLGLGLNRYSRAQQMQLHEWDAHGRQRRASPVPLTVVHEELLTSRDVALSHHPSAWVGQRMRLPEATHAAYALRQHYGDALPGTRH